MSAAIVQGSGLRPAPDAAAGCSPAIAAKLRAFRSQQEERKRRGLRVQVRPLDAAGEARFHADQAAFDAAVGREGELLNALVDTPSQTVTDLLLKVALLHGEEADFACPVWESWAETLAEESRRFGGRP